MTAKDMREFADMQRNRGRAYSLLKAGDRQANLKRAINCYEKALQIYTREDFPEEWASTQYDLGNAYQELPGGDRQTNLEQAITCYEKALQVYILPNEVWARIQLRLGDAYRDLPAGNQQVNLEQAEARYQMALQVYTSKDFPAQWAMTQFRLGETFRNLQRGSRQINLQNAFTCYQSALQVYTRKTFPKEWAMIQHSLGNMYYSLHDEERYFVIVQRPNLRDVIFYLTLPHHSLSLYRVQRPNLRDAIFCYQSALQAYTPEDFPIEWATTQYDLGSVYREIPEDRQGNLGQAIVCFQNVLQVRTLENAPIEWAQTQRRLGDTYCDLPAGDRQTNLEQAIACYEKALQVCTQKDFPNEWLAIQNSLKAIKDEQVKERLQEAEALRSAGDVQVSRGERTAAIESYWQALAIFRQMGQRGEEARMLCRIGGVQLAMGSRQHDATMQSYGQALALFQQIGDSAGQASALRGMGDADRAAAQDSYQRASDLLQRMTGSPSISRLLATGDERREAARQSYEQALSSFLSVGDSSKVDAVRGALDDLERLRIEQRDQVQRRIDEQEAMFHRAPPPASLDLPEHTQSTQTTDSFVASPTEETGPFPIIRAPRKQHRRLHVSQLTVIGLAAAFLMVLVMSGITTLLVLTHGNAQRAVTRSRGSNSTDYLATVVRTTYATHTPYQHVVSAVADRANIYYTAYGDSANNAWMLEQLDRRTAVSTPLLASAGISPLIVLGSANGWLVWLQFDPAKLTTKSSFHHQLPVTKRTWSLHYLSLTSLLQSGTFTPVKPLTLASGTFNQSSSPDWVYTPVQGIWFIQNTLLVATIDGDGISRLLNYQLDTPKHTTPIEIATAIPGHVFTSPTANDDGTEIYWSDEWRTDDGMLDSNIWTQQVSDVPNPFHGRWANHSVTEKQLFRSDGMSFFPEVVDNTLFMLSTAVVTDTIPATTVTTPAITPIATSAPTTTPYTPIISWADPGVYIASADRSVRGRLLMLPSNAPTSATIQVNSGQAWSPQVGSDFVLWQSDQGYQMFDVTTTSMVSVGNVLDGAHFLAVNGDTAVWTVDNTTNTTNSTNPPVTLLAFNWPTKP